MITEIGKRIAKLAARIEKAVVDAKEVVEELREISKHDKEDK